MPRTRSFVVAALAVLALAATSNALVIGVDLGTEFMKVALVKPGRPFEIVLNGFSKRKTTARRRSAERLITTKALHCTATD